MRGGWSAGLCLAFQTKDGDCTGIDLFCSGKNGESFPLDSMSFA